jgi:hypothetical protein
VHRGGTPIRATGGTMMLGLALGVAAGVAGLVGLNLLLSRRDRAPAPLSLDAAAERLRCDLVHFSFAGDGVVGGDGRAALLVPVEDEDPGRAAGGPPSALGLVFRRGDGLVTRYLRPGDLRSVEACPGEGLRVRLAEITSPVVVLRLEDPRELARWLHRLQALALSSRHA